ncbi:sugar ABC transporter ATP-binding protein [Fretibacterium sp. OH1220_COT-178]|uniref:sugar ABC transporter ATP-binding protein n=1 Tax=Fretibacterium sp. OH1220_COT-178 TaxID=2491047 RepID=UPI000F5F05D0|nr:sugar ABC transporter ATP-binding protein [Fretibacterium sp. OH1220_COT-178]RRD63884.1 sugar ABC transporter ATP-binding protein [Fretibacterium sp. OH1220_COT-178]
MTEPIVRLEHISKSFAGVPALADVSFELRGGEVHALLGENGAGKSTLMKILSGVYLRDEGRMTVLGREVGDLTPKGAKELGIAIIHQELNLCTHLTVAENIFLGREVVRGGRLADREMNDRAAEILERLNIAIPPTTPVGDLPVSKQQMVEIARALSEDARILIMDEPTSALTSREIDDLFAIIRTLRASGRGIVYISHRLEELRHIVDRVTVLRDGRWITTLDFADTSLPELIAHMVGREITEQFPRVRCPKGKKILEVRGLSAGRAVRDVGFELHEGEIVGVAGLMGAGRTEMTRAIFGADPRDGGEILLDGEPVKIEKPLDAIEAGIVLAPEDRKKDGLCTRLSVRENIALPNLDAMAGGSGVVDRGKERRTTDDTVRSLRVRLASPEQAAESLSGGNQQKVVIGKWLARNSRVVLFDEPTRGIDVAAKTEIYNLMNDLKQRGIGVLFVSSEMPEVLGVSDRVLVMCGGRITGDFPVEEATQERILECATRFTA